MALEQSFAHVYHDVEAEIAVLGHQLVLIHRGIDFFANTTLLYRFVNMDFADIHCYDTSLFRLLYEKSLAAALRFFGLHSDCWTCGKKTG
jgi:hypothetical protein